MLSRISRTTRLVRSVRPTLMRSFAVKSDPEEIFTKLSDTKDPQRSPFFQYTWGSWLKDDKTKKARRETKFSIEGITKLVRSLNAAAKDPKNTDKNDVHIIKPVEQLNDGSYMLNQNLLLLGEEKDVPVKSIASIHEGKHHRIYKITLSLGEELVLRIPYRLESMAAMSQKIKSEVATLDFLRLKLGANVPRVVAYGVDKANDVNSPYMLMEHIEGDLLMKKWEPLVADSPESNAKLSSVIDPIADFQEKLLSITFNKFGSLYFRDDVPAAQQNDLPYEGETDSMLVNRWRIGPSVEKAYSKYKNFLSDKVVMRLNGPWAKNEPLKLVESIAEIETENTKNRIAMANADAGKVEDTELLLRQLNTLEKLREYAPQMLNPESKSIMNVEEMFAPRLFAPDLDPLNVIVKDDGSYWFLDFEYTNIKPFILTSYPSFVAYQGAKVYNIAEEVPEFAELGEIEQQQYLFMYHKTRNERLWELALNKRRHDLIAIALPFIKLLKSPYLQALALRNDHDYLYVEGCLMQLADLWELLVANSIVNSTNKEYPLHFTEEEVKVHQDELQKYQHETVSSPFAATGGWVPQDMFEKLREQGILVEKENGDYEIDTEKVLEGKPE